MGQNERARTPGPVHMVDIEKATAEFREASRKETLLPLLT